MNNYKILFSLNILKSITTNFLDVFLVLYFLDISDSNILPLGIYKLVAILTIYIVIFSVRNFTKSKNRVALMRIGIILDFIYFLVIIILKEKVVDYIYLVGLLYGLEEGFYFSIYNILESDGVTNEERAKFAGIYTSMESILSIVFPLFFGTLIYKAGFLKSLTAVFIIIILRIVLSFMYKDKNIPKSKKTNMKEYFKITKDNKIYKQMYKVEFLNAIVYSEAAFAYISTIYVIKVFSDSFSLGIFTSIFNIITFFIGIIFANFIKKEHYEFAIKASMTFTIVSMIIMIFKCNAITIVFFNLFQTIAKKLEDLIVGNNQVNLCNDDIIKKEYKTEYWLTNETALVIGRTISASAFILLAFLNPTLMIMVYALLLAIYTINSIKLQKMIINSSK